jgi:hypothetical protein
VRTINLDNVQMRVVSVASADGIDAQTRFTFHHCSGSIWATYTGGNILLGFLMGTLSDRALAFDYIQVTRAGRLDKGESRCELAYDVDGRLRLTERFEWPSCESSGVNILEEIRETEPLEVRES